MKAASGPAAYTPSLLAAGIGLGVGVGMAADALSGADGDGAKPERSSEAHGGEAGGAYDPYDYESVSDYYDRKMADLVREGYEERQRRRDERERQRQLDRERQRQLDEERQRRAERFQRQRQLYEKLQTQDQKLFEEALTQIREGNHEEVERLVVERRQVVQQTYQVLADMSSNLSSLMARPDLKSSANRRSLIPTASGSAFWLRTFGNRARYRAQAGGLRPELGHLGLAAGYDLRLNATQFGVLAGYGRGELRFQGAQRFMPDPSLFKGPFAGLYVRRDFAPFSVQVGLAGGSLEHTSSRPSGRARAEARTRSWWLAPEARVGLRLDAGLMQFEPSFTARYARQSIRGFTETGIRAPATVGQRKVELLETRLELKAVREVGPGYIALKAGWQYRDDLNSNQAWVRRFGQLLRARLESGPGSSFYLGAEAEFELAPGLFLSLSGETVSGEGYQNISGMVSVYQAF